MKKTLLAVLALFPFTAMADYCVMELQQNGRLYGQNVFSGECRDAMRECARTRVNLERRSGVSGLACEKVADSTNPGPSIPGPRDPGPGYPGNGGPGVPPRGTRDLYVGDCHMDDDYTFDANQFVVPGMVGRSVIELVDMCKAEQRASRLQISKIMNVTYQGQAKPAQIQANCHVDNDYTFDPNQYVVALFGRNYLEMIQQCKEIGAALETSSSTRVMDIVPARVQLSPVSADCHIDDDYTFDKGQYVLPSVSAQTVMDAAQKCKELGKATNNSSTTRIYNVKQNAPASQVHQCHLDDDYSFDWNQYVVPVFAYSRMEAHNQCRDLQRFYFPSGVGHIQSW